MASAATTWVAASAANLSAAMTSVGRRNRQGEGKRGLRRSAAGAERVELSRRLQAPARAGWAWWGSGRRRAGRYRGGQRHERPVERLVALPASREPPRGKCAKTLGKCTTGHREG